MRTLDLTTLLCLSAAVLMLPLLSIAQAKTLAVHRVTEQEARAKKLPSAKIELVLRPGIGFMVTEVPDARTYLNVSGPPGGPLGLMLFPYQHPKGKAVDRALLKQALSARFPSIQIAFAQKSEELKIYGVKHTALAYQLGGGPAQQAGCVVLYPPPPNKGRTHGVAVMAFTTSGKLIPCSKLTQGQPVTSVKKLEVKVP